MLGKIERRIALVILLTALLPLASAMLLAYSLLDYASSVWLRPEVAQELERGIDLYKDYIRSVKDDMRHQTDGMIGDPGLEEAVRLHDTPEDTLARSTLSSHTIRSSRVARRGGLGRSHFLAAVTCSNRAAP